MIHSSVIKECIPKLLLVNIHLSSSFLYKKKRKKIFIIFIINSTGCFMYVQE